MVDSMAGEAASFGGKERLPCGRIAGAAGGQILSGSHDHMGQADESGARKVYRSSHGARHVIQADGAIG